MYSYNITLSSVTDRGYTSHEHLPNFGLINMNVPIKREQSQACLNYAEREAHRGEASTYGRVYDPMTMNFLSPDPVLQNPNNSQNYNRYSYCLNNPLKYVDPSGYTALYPWYEHIAGPNTYYTHYNDISDPTYTDGSGRVWQYKAESFETANFIGNSDGSWVYKNFEKYQEIIALFNNYDETQTTRQDNLSQNNNFKFTAGAGTFRVEGEGRVIKPMQGGNATPFLYSDAMNYIGLGLSGASIATSSITTFGNLSSKMSLLKCGRFSANVNGVLKAWSLGFQGNQYVSSSLVAAQKSSFLSNVKFLNGMKYLGVGASVLGIGISIAQFDNTNDPAQQFEYGFDIGMGAVGLIGMPGAATSGIYFASKPLMKLNAQYNVQATEGYSDVAKGQYNIMILPFK